MADFQIKITADASKAVAEAKLTQDALKQVAKSGTQAGAETADAAEKSKGKHNELKKSLQEIGKEFPIVGAVGRLMFNPIALAAAALTIGLQRIRQDVANLNEALTTSTWEGYGSAVKAQGKALEEASMGAAQFAREMERIRDATETASKASENLTTVFKAQMNAQDKLDSAHKALEIAQVEQGEKDPVKKQGRLLEIEERYAARKRQRDQEADDFELAQQRKKMESEQAAVGRLDKQLEGAREKQKGLKSEAQVNEELAVAERTLTKITEERDKKSERHQQLKDMSWARRSTPQEWEMNELGGQLGSLDAQVAAQRGIVGKLKGNAPDDINAWRGSQENISMLEGMRRGASDRANGIAANLPTQTAVRNIEADTRQQVGTMESATRFAGAAARGAAEQDRLVEQATQQVERTGRVARQTADALGRQAQFNDAVTDFMRRVESQVARLRNR